MHIFFNIDVNIKDVVGTGGAGAFAPINFKQQVHAPILKWVMVSS